MALELQIVLAFVLDALVGDPRWLPHPVRAIGSMAKLTERCTRFLIPWQWAAGFLTVALTIGVIVGSAYFLLRIAASIHPLLGDLASIYCIYFCVALRDLLKHTRDVYRALTTVSLAEARERVAMIVGRDTESLDETGVARATIESASESFVDGIAAPLFYAVLFGPLGAVAYRTINTLDSIFGYRNDRYRLFGWTAARLDDVANYLPSRLSVPFLVLAAGLLGGCETNGGPSNPLSELVAYSSGARASAPAPARQEAARPPEKPKTRAQAAMDCWAVAEKSHAGVSLDARADFVNKCIESKLKSPDADSRPDANQAAAPKPRQRASAKPAS